MEPIEALKTDDPKLIWRAIWDLASDERADVMSQILPFLSHPEPDVRGAALRYCIHFSSVEGLTLDNLIECFKQSSGEDEWYYHYDAALLIRRQGQAGIDFLFSYYDQAPYPVQKRAILLGLSVLRWSGDLLPVNRQALDQLLAKGLADQDDGVIMETIRSYEYLRDASVWDQVWLFREHESPYVRGAVLSYISAIKPDFAYPILLEKLRDPHYLIREYAADELGDMELDEPRKSEAIEHLRPLLNDEHEDVREIVEITIACLDDTYLDR
jgi:HEAT repeat protein